MPSVRRPVLALLAAAGLAGCGAASSPPSAPDAVVASGGVLQGHRVVPRRPAASTRPKPAVTDAELADAYALPAGVKAGPMAPQPGDAPAAKRRSAKATAATGVSPGAPSDAQIRRELHQMDQVLKGLRRTSAAHRAAVTRSGRAETPYGAPDLVARVISGGNAIAKFPYIWGGGHGSFVAQGYDCSGSVSYALAAAGLLHTPLTSGLLARWGAPGPGRWITIYANAGHVFMYVAGLRFDTSGRSGPLGTRWQTAPRSLAGFTVRHPPGL